jgi:hypothetical protein
MRRLSRALVAALVLSVALSPVALASKPPTACPADASGFVRVDRDGWWAATVQGLEIEAIDVYEDDGVTFTAEFEAFAMAVGFPDAAALQEFILITNWAKLDKNSNGFICKQEYPEQGKHWPAYFFNAVDDHSSRPH